MPPERSVVTDLTLPIFPLGVVLFPGTRLPLHLFEPRYRQMLADVRDGDGRFGIIAAIPGVAERDLPAGRIGCVAEVTDVEIMPDGRANIIVTGRERFALTAFVEHEAPYHVATGTIVHDEAGASPVALAVAADDVIANFKRVVQAVRTLNDDTDPLPDLPEDAAQVAWSVGAMIDLDLASRYRLLAERSPAARLTQIDHVLRKALPDLELQAALKAK
jgi:Lon protease-like protein